MCLVSGQAKPPDLSAAFSLWMDPQRIACAGPVRVSINIDRSDEAAVHLDSTCGGAGVNNTVTSNSVNVACAGILDGGSGNTPTSNTFYNTKILNLSGDVCTPAVAMPTKKAQRVFKAFRP